MTKKAVVITGVSGVGKDSLFNVIQDISRNAVNIKFSDPIKKALAIYTGLPRAIFDDRVERTKPIPFLDNLSPLDLLVKAYPVMPAIHPKLGLYATSRQVEEVLLHGGIPVFTDTRNKAEVEWLTETFEPDEIVLVKMRSQLRGQSLESDRYLSHLEFMLDDHCLNSLLVVNNHAHISGLDVPANLVLNLLNN